MVQPQPKFQPLALSHLYPSGWYHLPCSSDNVQMSSDYSHSHTLCPFCQQVWPTCFPDRSQISTCFFVSLLCTAQVTQHSGHTYWPLCCSLSILFPQSTWKGRLNRWIIELIVLPLLKDPQWLQPQGNVQASYCDRAKAHVWPGTHNIIFPAQSLQPHWPSSPPQGLSNLLQILFSQFLSHFGPNSNVPGVSRLTNLKVATLLNKTCYTLFSTLFYGLYNFLEVILFIRYERVYL